jgi:hypothetical protein
MGLELSFTCLETIQTTRIPKRISSLSIPLISLIKKLIRLKILLNKN